MRTVLAKVLACLAMLSLTAAHAQQPRLEEQLLVLPLPIPVLAYVVKPLTVSAALPLDQFTSVNDGPPTQLFDESLSSDK